MDSDVVSISRLETVREVVSVAALTVAVLAMLVLSAAPVGAAGMKFGDAAPLNSYAAVDLAIAHNIQTNDRVPELTTDGAGNWVAVWRSEDDTGGIGGDWDILFARSTDNGATWSAAAPLNRLTIIWTTQSPAPGGSR